MPFRAESSSFRGYSVRKPFPFHVCTMDDDSYGNKRLTEKNRQKTNNNLNRPRCTIQMSIKIKGCHLYKTNGNGGKRQTALPPEKIILPCGTVSIALPLCFTFISPTSTFVVLRSLVPGFFCRRPLFAYCSRSRYFRLTDLMNARMSD